MFSKFSKNSYKNNQNIKKFPRQIYSKLLKVPFKQFKSKKNAKEFYTSLFKDLKDLSCMLTERESAWIVSYKEVFYSAKSGLSFL